MPRAGQGELQAFEVFLQRLPIRLTQVVIRGLVQSVPRNEAGLIEFDSFLPFFSSVATDMFIQVISRKLRIPLA